VVPCGWLTENSASATPGGITITRIFEAPRELVYQAWTEPGHFAQWFGGRESSIPLSTVAMDVRPGGAWRALMISGPDKVEIPWKGVYLEVAPPAKLVFTLSDQPGDEAEVVTVVLTDLGGKTEMVFHPGGGRLNEEQYEGVEAGRLAEDNRENEGPGLAGARLAGRTDPRDPGAGLDCRRRLGPDPP
jgi:uncharacterized protein YndB with AHSA1/START domain